MSPAMQFNRSKLKAVILHTCESCPPDQLGAVKLNKVLYFSDMLRYAQATVPITGATYRKRPYGPTCVELLPTLRELEHEGALEVTSSEYFGLKKTNYRCLKAPDLNVLNGDELSLLSEVIQFVCTQNTAKTISEFSHKAPWERAEFGDDIPYSTAYLLFPNMVSQEAFEATAKGFEPIEKARQSGDSVVFADFSVLRRRLGEKSGSLSV